MDQFSNLKVGELFTLERKLKNNPHKPALWRKKSTRTAWLASGHKGINGRPAWFYFGNAETVYKWRLMEGESND
jgi:hypothetical protein